MIYTWVKFRLIILAVIAFIVGCAASAPVQEMSDARQAITAAVDADAAQLAPVLLDEAQRYLDVAEGQIRDRSFNLALTNAIRARNIAVEALQTAQDALARPVDD